MAFDDFYTKEEFLTTENKGVDICTAVKDYFIEKDPVKAKIDP